MNLMSSVPVFLAAFALFTACKLGGVASRGGEAAAFAIAEEVEMPGEDEMLVGGYGPGDVSEPGAKLAYGLVEEAIYAQYPTRALVDAVSLETQVVAGLNYRFRVEMTGAPDARDVFEAVVYRNLDDVYELTSLHKIR